MISVGPDIAKGTGDAELAQMAHDAKAAIVTFNVKHFQKLVCRRPREGNHQQLRHASALFLRMPKPQAAQRLAALLPHIEFEWSHAQQMPPNADRRIFLSITHDRVTIER